MTCGCAGPRRHRREGTNGPAQPVTLGCVHALPGVLVTRPIGALGDLRPPGPRTGGSARRHAGCPSGRQATCARPDCQLRSSHRPPSLRSSSAGQEGIGARGSELGAPQLELVCLCSVRPGGTSLESSRCGARYRDMPLSVTSTSIDRDGGSPQLQCARVCALHVLHCVLVSGVDVRQSPLRMQQVPVGGYRGAMHVHTSGYRGADSRPDSDQSIWCT